MPMACPRRLIRHLARRVHWFRVRSPPRPVAVQSHAELIMSRMQKFSNTSAVEAAMTDRRVLIVGGDGRSQQIERLREAFPTTEFEWRTTREADTRTDAIERLIRNGGFDIVIILLLARHAHTRAARRLCSTCGKPLLWCRRPTAAAVVRAIEQHRAARLTQSN